MASTLPLYRKSPQEILLSLNVNPTVTNPLFTNTPRKELNSQKVYLGFRYVSRPVYDKIVQRILKISIIFFSAAAIVYTAVYHTPMVLPVVSCLFFVNLYLAPLVLGSSQQQAAYRALRHMNLNGMKAIEKQLQTLTLDQIKVRFKDYFNVPSEIQLPGNVILENENLRNFLIPTLSRLEYWKSQKDLAHRYQSDWEVNKENELKKLKETSPSLCLNEYEKKRLEISILSKDRATKALKEVDLPHQRKNGELISAIRASYVMHVIEHPTDKRAISEFGEITHFAEFERKFFKDFEEKQAYFKRSNQKGFVSLQFFIENIQKLNEISKKIFEEES